MSRELAQNDGPRASTTDAAILLVVVHPVDSPINVHCGAAGKRANPIAAQRERGAESCVWQCYRLPFSS
jgi:hypothetical protein